MKPRDPKLQARLPSLLTLGNPPDEPLPTGRPAPQQVESIGRAFQQRVSVDHPLPKRLYDALFEQRRDDLRLEVVLQEFILWQVRC